MLYTWMLICVNPRHLLVFFHLPYGFLYFRARTVSWKSTGPKMQISVQWAVCILTIINMDFYTYNTHVHIHISTYHKYIYIYILIYIYTHFLSVWCYLYLWLWLIMHVYLYITNNYIYIYDHVCIWHHMTLYYDIIWFSLILSLSLSLHCPIQEFSHRLKASQRPSPRNSLSASELCGKPRHVTAPGSRQNRKLWLYMSCISSYVYYI